MSLIQRCVLISESWYTLYKRCPHLKGLEFTVYRGVLVGIEEFHYTHTEVSSFQGVGIEKFHYTSVVMQLE